MQKALVIGFGRSGKSASSFLKKRGYQVFIYDEHQTEFGNYASMGQKGVENFPLVILSPGIPDQHPLVQEAKRKRCEVISEVELALRELKNPIIGVTGTNGKTTTVLLLEHFFHSQKIKAKAVGNIGFPLTSFEGEEVLIIELSSFQLQNTFSKVLDVAILLNISPNHLDHHRSYKEYIEAKLHIFDLVKPGGLKVSHPRIKKQFLDNSEEIRSFSLRKKYPSPLPIENIAAAMEAARYFDLDLTICHKTLGTFTLPSHRMEYLGYKGGITWINDSKATTPEAVVHGASSIRRPLILIVGGMDKNLSFTIWRKKLPSQVKSIIAMGFAAKKIEQSLESKFKVNIVKDLQEAVSLARKLADEGDTILLSPGCTSFDQYANFEERGEAFKEMVETMGEL